MLMIRCQLRHYVALRYIRYVATIHSVYYDIDIQRH